MNKTFKKIINDLYNLAKQNNFNYWCNDIMEYNKSLDTVTVSKTYIILESIFKGKRSMAEFR